MNLKDMIQEGKDFFYIEATFFKDQCLQTTKISFDGKVKKIHLNSNQYPSLSVLLGTSPSIFSLPEDINLIHEAPALRRKFLDLHLAQSDPLYIHHFSKYWKAMKERNFLLKSKTLDAIDCYENVMAVSAQYILQARRKFLMDLEETLREHGKTLSFNQELIEIAFRGSFPEKTLEYLELLKKSRKKEMDLGSTLYGPHRDDLDFLINKKEAVKYASKGQRKTIAASIRLSQWKLLSENLNHQAIFGVDDYEETLDAQRQISLTNHFYSMGQVFLTTPAKPKNENLLSSDEKLICIARGSTYV